MTATLLSALSRLSEAGGDGILSGSVVAEVSGAALDRLLRRRVLVEEAPLADWEVCAGCECGLLARPIRRIGDGYRAECPLDASSDAAVSADDLRAFRIEPCNLAGEVAAELNLHGQADAVARALWYLGALSTGRQVFLAVASAALDGDGLIPILRRAAGADPVTLIALHSPPASTRARLDDAGIHLTTLTALADAVGAPAGPRGLEAVLQPANATPELIVDTAAGALEWQGRRVTLTHQLCPAFRILVDAALSRKPIVPPQVLEGASGREAKDLVRELRARLISAGFPPTAAKHMIALVRGRGYQLGVAPDRIARRERREVAVQE